MDDDMALVNDYALREAEAAFEALSLDRNAQIGFHSPLETRSLTEINCARDRVPG